jgi:DNA invertase Pin-like site-specific DNA recombinase
VVEYCSGATQQQITARYGVHVQTIRKILRDAGVSVRDHRAVFTREEIHTIRTAHAQGTSAHELDRQYGVAHTTVLRYLC